MRKRRLKLNKIKLSEKQIFLILAIDLFVALLLPIGIGLLIIHYLGEMSLLASVFIGIAPILIMFAFFLFLISDKWEIKNHE